MLQVFQRINKSVKFKFIIRTAIILIPVFFLGLNSNVHSYSSVNNEKHSVSYNDSLKEMVTGRDMKQMMDNMHDKMKKNEKTGDPDYDFAAMMVEHHKGAIDLSEYVMDNGQDGWVRSFADKTIQDQEKEIEELKSFIHQGSEALHHKEDKIKNEDNENMTGSSRENMEIMEDMTRQVNAMNMTGNPDQDYISMMILHHRASIQMAEAYLDEGKDEQLREMAERMITKQEEDIASLEQWQQEKK